MGRNPWYRAKPRELQHEPTGRYWPAVAPQHNEYADTLTLGLELCARCSAWRAFVVRDGLPLRTAWSAPCSVSSPAAEGVPEDEPS